MPHIKHVILFLILSLSLIGYASPLTPSEIGVTGTQTKSNPPVANGNESLEIVDVQKQPNGSYKVTIKYSFPVGKIGIWQARTIATDKLPTHSEEYGTPSPLLPGNHIVEIDLAYPYVRSYPSISDSTNKGVTTKHIVVQFIDLTKTNPAERVYMETIKDFSITWPPSDFYRSNLSNFGKSTTELLTSAVDLIDQGQASSLREAKNLLEYVISKEPKNSAAFVELARIAMKSNWGAEGLSQAQQFIATALLHQPENANAWVLKGYAFTHQGRFQDAEKSLAKAAAIGTNNPWLWVNWGEMLAKQGRTDSAIEKYLMAVQGSRPRNTYDNARRAGYYYLLELKPKYLPTDKADRLHVKRISEFSELPCFMAEYARFILSRRNDVAAAKNMAADSIKGGCTNTDAKKVIGISHYYSWANTPSDKDQGELALGRLNFPEGPSLFVELAQADSGIPVIKKLLKNGSNIDQINNNQLTALAVALVDGDRDAAKRLISLGASLTISTSDGNFPLGFIPLMNRDIEGIKFMRANGTDYSKLKWRGKTAADIAREIGDLNLFKALGLRQPKKSI